MRSAKSVNVVCFQKFCDKGTQPWYGKRIKYFQDVKLYGFQWESMHFPLMYHLQLYFVLNNTAHPATSNQIKEIWKPIFWPETFL